MRDANYEKLTGQADLHAPTILDRLGFFRALRGIFRTLRFIELGAKLHTGTLSGERAYQVTATDVVSPEDVYFLDQTNTPTLLCAGRARVSTRALVSDFRPAAGDFL